MLTEAEIRYRRKCADIVAKLEAAPNVRIAEQSWERGRLTLQLILPSGKPKTMKVRP